MKIDRVFNPEEELTDRDIAFIALANKVGEILADRDSHPKDVFDKAYDYFFFGCKSREDYCRLVNYCIKDEDIRRELKL